MDNNPPSTQAAPNTKLPPALKAGQAAARRGAFAQAEALLNEALESLAPDATGWRRQTLSALGDVRRTTGDMSGARAAYEAALAHAETAGPAERGALWIALAQVAQGLNELTVAAEHAQRACAACAQAGDDRGIARAAITSGRIAMLAGRLPAARIMLDEAIAAARRSGDESLEAEALGFSGYLWLAGTPRRPAQGLACLNEAIAMVSSWGDRSGLLVNTLLLGDAQLALGALEDAERTFEEAATLAQQLGNPIEEGIARVNQALVAVERGRLKDANTHAIQAQCLADAHAQPFVGGLARGVGALIQAYRGAYAQAAETFDALLAEAEAPGNDYLASLALLWAAEARLHMGDAEGARRAAEAHEALATATGRTEGAARRDALWAEALGRLGHHTQSQALAARSRLEADASQSLGDRARALKALAWSALSQGDAAVARKAAESALSAAQRMGGRLLAAECTGLLGEIASRTAHFDARPYFRALASTGASSGCPMFVAWGRAFVDRAAAVAALPPLDADTRARLLSYPERRRLRENG